MNTVSEGFMAFMKESGAVGDAFMALTKTESEKSALDEKTQELAYIAVLAATRMSGGLGFHVTRAKQLGATRDEVKSALLVGLPAVGLAVTENFALALSAYDAP